MLRKKQHVGNLTYEQKKRICTWKRDTTSLTQGQLAARAKRELAKNKAPAQGIISAIFARKDVYLYAKEEDLQA
ncbi:hypothetical protein PPTG_21048 [Phytophthora nicotianae INRA-310]|uniref:HTH psq-type domain-containing protein n=1 Tax=Phytophthora nicotianae (strain INRA-310) TaxID=761204 RepID=W2R967_PHYN3|nr:hypothetical protein PPTG_21048 [Phytophthora nicotianae INRA-310]ETN21075.1 hypothetical protein PPTG_21048 [Phytophthora nicotianae INRA-310]